jgi:hypothetical protein
VWWRTTSASKSGGNRKTLVYRSPGSPTDAKELECRTRISAWRWRTACLA